MMLVCYITVLYPICPFYRWHFTASPVVPALASAHAKASMVGDRELQQTSAPHHL